MPLTDLERLSVQRLLEKRQTFKQGVAELTTAVCAVDLNAEPKELSALFPLVARTHQLLKARHTNVDLWRTGSALYSTCLHLKFSPEELAKLQQFSADAHAFLQEDEAAGEAAAAGDASSGAESTGMPLTEAGLMELMSGPPPPPEAHYDDAGPIIDEQSERWRRAQVSGALPAAAEAEAAAGGAAAAGSAQAPPRPRTVQQQRQDLQRQILEGIQAVYSGMEAVTRGTEAIGRELESVLEMISTRAVEASMQQQQQPSRPPASKKVLAALPVVDATEETLREWGAGASCAVCTCELVVGDKVQVLPCKHKYHPDCVAPWMAKDNTCPMCRKELPTDDPHYEAKKERLAEEEVERRGAANALRGGEHMYI